MAKGRSKRGRRRRFSTPTVPGAMTACLMLVAASATAAGVPADRPQPVGQGRPPTGNQRVSGPVDNAWTLPNVNQATGSMDGVDGSGPMIPAVFTGDIPTTVLDSYRRARDLITKTQPGCRLPLELLEAIGKVETSHARNGLVDANGTALRPILGPVLDGNGFAVIADTDGGRLDGDPVWDRAVGSMQFLPSTWASWSADGNGDHRADPENVYDASLAAARYLCAENRDLGTPEGLDEAIFSYNHSTSYRNLVLAWMSTYAGGTVAVPDATVPTGRPPVQLVALPVPTRTGAPRPPAPAAPAAPPATTTPAPVPVPTTTTLPPPPPPTAVPTVPPATTQPAGPLPDPVCGATGLLGAVTGLVGGLLGSRDHEPNC
jgi:hypothetical protein